MSDITNITASYKKQTYIDKASENKRTDTRKTRESDQKSEIPEDSVSLSETSREMQIAKEEVTSTPDTSAQEIREEKVEQLRQEVNEGKYQVNADQVAEKLIGSIISDYV